MTADDQLRAFLSRSEDLYPFGLPLRILENRCVHEKLNALQQLSEEENNFASARSLIFITDHPLENVEREFADSIVEKGIQRECSGVECVHMPVTELDDFVRENTDQDLFIFGVVPRGYSLGLKRNGSRSILVAPSLFEMMQDKQKKMFFWKELKRYLKAR